jgi:hypothetical protein
MATQPKKKPETMSLRIPVHRIEDLHLIGKIEEREIPWMLRRAIDYWCDRYFDEHPGARTQQAPAPAATAPATGVASQPEIERLKARIAELEAKVDRKPAVRYTLRTPKGGSHPVKSVEPAVAVPETQISKHSVKH